MFPLDTSSTRTGRKYVVFEAGLGKLPGCKQTVRSLGPGFQPWCHPLQSSGLIISVFLSAPITFFHLIRLRGEGQVLKSEGHSI